MLHPFERLKNEYATCLAGMKIAPSRQSEVDAVVGKLMRFDNAGRYLPIVLSTHVPAPWIAATFEREASSDFSKSPAQGDPWNRVSVHVPKGLGPYQSWEAAAADAYRRGGQAVVGQENWTWERACYEAERFNGFGYRDYHSMRSPYLWGGTNMQQKGKYTADGTFSETQWDQQIGVVPLMMGMAQRKTGQSFVGDWPFPAPITSGAVPTLPADHTGIADAFLVQRALNAQGYGPLRVDGSYGKITESAVRAFQKDHPPLLVDGIAGPATAAALGIAQ